MALTKVTGSVIKDSVSLSGNVSVGGTLTYQDVTNVDALGIGTFRTGIKVLAGQVDVGSNIKLGNAGVITATSFVGSGANLTSLPSQLTLSNNADNRVITGGSGVNLNGEANLTFDGNKLGVNRSGTLQYGISFAAAALDNNRIGWHDGSSSKKAAIGVDDSGDSLNFYTGASTTGRLRIDSDGAVNIGSNPAQATGTNTQNAILTVKGYPAGETSAAILALVRGNNTTSTASGHTLGRIVFSDKQAGEYAFIEGEAEANGAVGDTPGRLVFSTSSDNSSAPTERLRITSSGRVGINQNSPDRLLEVSNDNAAAAKFGGAAGGQDFSIEIGQLSANSSAGFNATGGSGSSMLFRNNGTEAMRLNSSNNGGGVGIGTQTIADAKSVNVYTVGSGDGKYAMQIENGYGSQSGGNILKLKCGRGDGTVDVDLIRMELYNNTRIFSVDNSGLMRFRSGCGSGSQDALAVYGVRAWINFSSTNNVIRGKGGLTGVTDRGIGQHTYNFSTNMPDDDYTVTCNSGNSGGGTSNRNRMSAYSLTTSNSRIDDYDSGAGQTPTHTDRQMVHVMVVR